MPPSPQYPEAYELARVLNAFAAQARDVIKSRQSLHDSLLLQPDPWLGKRRRDFEAAFQHDNSKLHDVADGAQKLASRILSQRDAAVAALAKTGGKP